MYYVYVSSSYNTLVVDSTATLMEGFDRLLDMGQHYTAAHLATNRRAYICVFMNLFTITMRRIKKGSIVYPKKSKQS